MGTVGYMSPEQVRGKISEIDHRSDIFSFGCILFEAATRQRAFRGQDDIDSLHKIVHGPTPQVRDFNPLAPEQLERIVRRCLAKDPDKRYQAIKDIAIELEELQQDADLWLREYNETRTHSGKYCFGKTPLQTFQDAKPLAQAKELDRFFVATLPDTSSSLSGQEVIA